MSASAPTLEIDDLSFLAGGGEMGELIRQLDWSQTALGPIELWPQSLKTSISTSLGCAFPIVLWWGPELTVLYNDEYRACLGAKHPWALGKPGAVAWAEIWDVIAPMLDQVVRHGEATRSRDLLLHVDRQGYPEEAYFSFSYSPIRTEHGRTGGIFCPVIETTDKVIGERRLCTLRDLASASPGADSELAVCQGVLEVLGANPQDVPFALLYRIDDGRAELAGAAGIEPGSPAAPKNLPLADGAAAAGRSWPLGAVVDGGKNMVLDDLRARFDELPAGVWKTPVQSAMVLPILLPGRSHASLVLVAAISPMRSLDASYRTFYELVAKQIASVLADAKALEEERRRAEALAEVDRAKIAFFSNVSHEFRTPLTLMLAPIEEALAEPAEPHQRARLELLHRNSLRLQKLVNTLLDFSRIEAGRIQATYEPTDLAALTADLASVFRSAIERAGISLRVDCAPLEELIYVDREMYEKIVLNLLSNAFKFTLEGEIGLTLRDAGDAVELHVSDTGSGIAEDQLAHIFERFHRIDGAAARTLEGTGIGLALVHELVNLHGGRVEARSSLGRGSTFTVRLPKGKRHLPTDKIADLAHLTPTTLSPRHFVEEALRWLPDGRTEPAEGSAFPGTPDTPAEGPRPRIVWADDNADMREYVARLLAPRYAVEGVSDGEQALAAIHRQAPDLILADVMMPRLDGFGLLRAVRADERLRAIPLILLSARAGEESRVEGMTAGADDYVVKPFGARELVARVDAHLKLAGVRREAEQALHRQAYMLKLTDVLRPLVDAEEIQLAAMRVLGEHLGVTRAQFYIADATGDYLRSAGGYTVGMEPVTHRLRLDDFGAYVKEAFRAGLTLAVADVAADPRISPAELEAYQALGIRAYVGIPLLKGGRFVAGLGLHAATPREWLATEVAIAEETAERTWDAVERALAEQALRQSEDKYQTLFDSIDEGLAIVELIRDADGHAIDLVFLDVNAVFERLTGLGDVRGKRRSETLHPMDKAWFELLDEVSRTGESRRIEQYRPATARWYRCYVSRIGEASGGQVAIVFEDITDRKRNERRQEFLLKLSDTLRPSSDALEIQRAAMQVIGEELQVDRTLYFEFERDGEQYSVADNWVKPGVPKRTGRFSTSVFPSIFAGLCRGEALVVNDVQTTTLLTDAEKAVAARASIGAFVGVPLVKEGTLVAQLGVQQTGPREWTPDEILILQETAERTWAAVERTRAEEALRQSEERLRLQLQELRQAQAHLQEADQRKNNFLAMLGHELRNPLAAIRSGVLLLRSDKARQESRTMALPIVAEQVAHMERLVDDLLDLTRIVQGRVQVRRERMAVQEALRQALEMVRSQAEAGQFLIEVKVPEAPLVVLGDSVRLTQVFMNVLDNAIKYSADARRIDVEAAHDGDHAVVRVRDYGLGVPSELQPRIFEPFVQVSPGLTLQAGLGLGLAVVRQLMRLHDGDIEVFSAGENQGSEFVLRLPLETAH